MGERSGGRHGRRHRPPGGRHGGQRAGRAGDAGRLGSHRDPRPPADPGGAARRRAGGDPAAAHRGSRAARPRRARRADPPAGHARVGRLRPVPDPGPVRLAVRADPGHRLRRRGLSRLAGDVRREGRRQPAAGHRERDGRRGPARLRHLDRAVPAGRPDDPGQHHRRAGAEQPGRHRDRRARPLLARLHPGSVALGHPEPERLLPEAVRHRLPRGSTAPGTGTTLAVIAEGDLDADDQGPAHRGGEAGPAAGPGEPW